MEKTDFSSLDWGTSQGRPRTMDVIQVMVSVETLVGKYVQALINRVECEARLTQRQVKLTETELREYLNYLLTQRTLICDDSCPTYGRLRSLWIPSFWQYILTCVGKYRDRKYAIEIRPIAAEPSTMSFEEAKLVSEKLAQFEGVINLVYGGMPREVFGDKVVMTSAVIANQVYSMNDSATPMNQYVVAFVNSQLAKEAAFAALYRTQYDYVEEIALLMDSTKLL